MFENILVLTDFSAYARKFLECIEDLPEVKEVVILNVVSKDPKAKKWDPVSEIKKAKTRLAKEKALIRSPNVKATVRAVSVATTSDIPMAIQRVASEENSQLVVMGARGKNIIQSILLGSMTKNILRFGDKHLLIMRYKTAGNSGLAHPGAKGTSEVEEAPKGPEILDKFGISILSKVLIPTDFSQSAEAAISSISSMKGIGEIVLLHVVSKGESKEEIDATIKDATEKLNAISQKLSKGDMKVTPRLAVGSPVELMRSIADEEDVSMIAMSEVGEDANWVDRIGSVASDVASTANRPVLIVRQKLAFLRLHG
jgi:nucleotide-binding universal stress UspA family protein